MTKIFLVGMPGSGKTTLGKQLAKKLGMSFIDLDKEIENDERRSVTDIFEEMGESYFREAERRVLLAAIDKTESFVMATGGGAACFFDNLEEMKKAGLTIYLQVSPAELFRRLKHQSSHRPLLKGKTDEDLLTEIKQKLTARNPFYKQTALFIQSDSISVDDLYEMIKRKNQG